jgi:hypothetical protein
VLTAEWMHLTPLLTFISVLLIAVTGTVVGASAAHADQSDIAWTGQASDSNNNWDGETYGSELFVTVSHSGLAQPAPGQVTALDKGSAVANRVLTPGAHNRTAPVNASAVIAASARSVVCLRIPVSRTGLCTDTDDATSAFETDLTGG